MNKKSEKELSMWERITDYKILSDEIKDGKRVVVARTHSGALVTCNIPLHTEEEERELGAKLAVAMTKLVHPDLDLSECERIKIVK